MTLSQHQMQFAEDVARLIDYIYQEQYAITFGEAYRTKEQAEIYAKEGKGILDSLHCKRLAIDINLFKGNVWLTDHGSYERFGCYWENLDARNRWGGRFKRDDANHFERQDT